MRRRGVWRYSWWRHNGSDRGPTLRVRWLLLFALCLICKQQRRDPDRRGTLPGRLTPKDGLKTSGYRRSPGMDTAWWNRCLPPERLKPGRVAKPRPWPTGVGKRRPTRRGGGRLLRGCRAAQRTAYASPPPASGGLEAGRGTQGWKAQYPHFTVSSNTHQIRRIRR